LTILLAQGVDVDAHFAEIINGLHEKYEELMAMDPVTVDTAPRDTPVGGVYLFFEDGVPLYAGRTKRSIRDRLQAHVDPSATDCPFAWRLAREQTSRPATYKKEGGQKQLLADPEFRSVYEGAKHRIRLMEVRYVGESHPLRQALLEIYVAVVAGAKHNDFDTH
jgi:hypothetical protein